MKRLYFIVFLIHCLTQTIAQNFSKPLQSLIDAERAFARLSQETNTVNAFVHFLSPNAILMIKGEEVNGLEAWKAKVSDESLLTWYPVFVDISSSGDFGYTTGPYDYYQNRKDSLPVFRGYYSTIWNIEATGEWKVLFDLGGGIAESNIVSLSTSEKALKPSNKKQNRDKALKRFLAHDKEYIKVINTTGKSFDPTLFSSECRMIRPGFEPFVGSKSINQVNENGIKYFFTHLNGKIAESCDLAYSYGKVKITSIRDGIEQMSDNSVFRIWKKEDNEWKIVLDVIGQ